MAERIRFHIKALVFDWLGALTEPTREEWRLLEPMLDDPEGEALEQAWSLLYREPWFTLADREGAIEARLRSESEDVVNRAVGVLRAAQRWNAGRVAELLEPFV